MNPKYLNCSNAQEAETADFERRRKEAAEQADSKTAKNRAKRQKRKDRAKVKSADKNNDGDLSAGDGVPLKKRRVVNGTELMFRKPDEGEIDEDEEVGEHDQLVDEEPGSACLGRPEEPLEGARIALEREIIIHEDD